MELRLEDKTYHFYPEYAKEKLLAISNHDDVALKKIMFDYTGVEGLHIIGNHARLVFHGDMIPFYIKACQQVLLEDLTICYAQETYSQGIIRVNEERYMELAIDAERYPWEILNGRCYFMRDGKKQELTHWLEMDTERKAPSYEIRDVYLKNQEQDGLEVDFLPIRKDLLGIKITGEGIFPAHSRVGNTVILRHHRRTHPAIYVCDSKEVVLKNIKIEDTRGMAVLAERTENITLDQVKVALPQVSEGISHRVYTAMADASHFVYCSGKIHLKGCLFENQLDDGANIHGIYLRIEQAACPDQSDREGQEEQPGQAERLGQVDQSEAVTVLAHWVHPMQVGVPFGKVGDRVGILDQETLLTVGTARIKEIHILNQDYADICLEGLSGKAGPGYALENLEYAPEVLIEDCTFRNNRARGILLTSAGKTVIRNNYFQNAGAAILIEGDANYWFESGGVKSILVEHNVFDNCDYVSDWGQAPIQVSPKISREEHGKWYHDQLIIRNNEFRCFDERLLNAEGIRDIIWQENRVIHTEEYPPVIIDRAEKADERLQPVLRRWIEEYQKNCDMDFAKAFQEVQDIAGSDKAKEYSTYLLFFESLAPYLPGHYQRQGIPQEIAASTLLDLRWKTQECERVHGTHGIFVPDWIARSFRVKCFTLGRLQFELFKAPVDYPRKVPYVINVHIPSSGPLNHEECRKAYALAKEFFLTYFRQYFKDGEPQFYCDSWLLTPAHQEILRRDSNILSFMDDYEIYRFDPDPKGHDLWRIFLQEDCRDLKNLPEGTSLQRSYKKWLLEGHYSGEGKGSMSLSR